MHLNLAIFFFLFALLSLGFLWVQSQMNKPSLPITLLLPFEAGQSFRVYAHHATFWLFWAALFFLIVAFSNPTRVTQEKMPQGALAKSALPREGIAIYFLLDESGSMVEKVPTVNRYGRPESIRKIDLAKSAIIDFVEGAKGLDLPGRVNDLVGLIAFARVPDILCPLTLNRQEFEARLKAIEPIQEDERNGTAIGYAIFKAVNIIVATKYFAKRQEESHKEAYSIQNQAIIIVTDGLQSPNPADKDNPFRFMPPEEAINYAKQNDIKVFFIGVDPIFSQPEFKDDVSKLKKAIQGSGGEFFLTTSSVPIEDIFSQIDRMEKSELPPESVVAGEAKRVREVPIWDLFVMLALMSLLASCLMETTIARSAP